MNEVLRGYLDNKDYIDKKLFRDGSFKIEDLFAFGDKLSDQLGQDLSSLVDFIRFDYRKNPKKETRFSITSKELPNILNLWALWSLEKKLNDEIKGGKSEVDDGGDPQEIEFAEDAKISEEDLAKAPLREKARDMIGMKLAKHGERLEEIFFNHRVGFNDSDLPKTADESGPFRVSLNRMPRVMHDIAYLLGIVAFTFYDHKTQNVNRKATKPEITEQLVKYLW